jgi:hypothetical protein
MSMAIIAATISNRDLGSGDQAADMKPATGSRSAWCSGADAGLVWGVSFQLTRRKGYGRAPTLDEAKAAFKAEYLSWKGGGG